MPNPKILLLDLETAPNILTSFSLYEKKGIALPYEGILQERYIICASWKWYGEPKIYSCAVEPKPLWPFNPNRDRGIVKQLHEVYSKADAVVAHNGDDFDVPWLRSRVIYYGFPPLPPIIQIDTRKLAKNKFYFNSNRLDYLGAFFGIGKKLKTDYGLWLECLNGNKEAIEKMVTYNRRDVYPLLEKVFERLLPHVPAKLNYAIYGAGRTVCPSCGVPKLQRRGYQKTRTAVYQRFQCQGCGAWSKATKSEKDQKPEVS